MANQRIYYAVEQVMIRPDGTGNGFQTVAGAWQSGNVMHGIQSFSTTTNFNLKPVFELGQLAVYQQLEDIPDIEVNASKLIDGYCPIYLMATCDTTGPQLSQRGATKCDIGLAIFKSDDQQSASGTPANEVIMPDMFVNSVSYKFNVSDEFMEDVKFVGNDRIWSQDPWMASGTHNGIVGSQSNEYISDYTQNGQFLNNNDVPIGVGGVQRRQNLNLTPTGGWAVGQSGTGVFANDSNGQCTDYDCTVLPRQIYGMVPTGAAAGCVDLTGAFSATRPHLSNIAVSVDFKREKIEELGTKAPYFRNISYPVDVTTEIEMTATSGDMISATQAGILTPSGASACANSGNLLNSTIRVATCEGLRVYCGTKNKLASTNYSGGDAKGGNVKVTYTYKTYNDFTVMHPQDPAAYGETTVFDTTHQSGASACMWANRAASLTG